MESYVPISHLLDHILIVSEGRSECNTHDARQRRKLRAPDYTEMRIFGSTWIQTKCCMLSHGFIALPMPANKTVSDQDRRSRFFVAAIMYVLASVNKFAMNAIQLLDFTHPAMSKV